MLIEAGVQRETARQTIMRNYGLASDELQGILSEISWGNKI